MSKLKPVAIELDALDALAAEDLEHRVHVGNPLLVEDVEGPREQQLGDVHEERLHARAREAADLPVVEPERSRAEHEAGAPLDDRLQQCVVVVEVVLEVGVLDEHDRPRRRLQPATNGGAFAARPVLVDDLEPGRPSNVCTISRVPSVLLLSTTMTSCGMTNCLPRSSSSTARR